MTPEQRFRVYGPVVPMDKPKSYRFVWWGIGLVTAFAGWFV